MADFYEVWLCRGTVLDKLEALLDAREAAREEELKAATDIKRVYRGKVKRQPFPYSSRPFCLHGCRFVGDLLFYWRL